MIMNINRLESRGVKLANISIRKNIINIYFKYVYILKFIKIKSLQFI